jgi:hypothetical protein
MKADDRLDGALRIQEQFVQSKSQILLELA